MKCNARWKGACLFAIAAIFCAEQAGAQHASPVPLRRQLAIAHFKAGSDAVQANRTAAAEREFLAGEVADPTLPQNFFALANLYIRENNLIGADIQLRSLIGIAPRTPQAHFFLAEVQRAEHLDDQAVKNYDVELALNPNDRAALAGRKIALANLQRAGLPTPKAVAIVLPTPAPARSTQAPRASGPTPAPAPTASPLALNDGTKSDAKQYLLDVASDFNFTRALPTVDVARDPSKLAADLAKLERDRAAGAEQFLAIGTTALLTGRLDIAESAYLDAQKKAPKDWRPVYLAGLVAQISGDAALARTRFAASRDIMPRPESLTSLAILDLAAGDLASAQREAQQATALDGSYEPAHFTAGMIALVAADAPRAASELTSAIVLGTAPERAPFFLQVAQSAKTPT